MITSLEKNAAVNATIETSAMMIRIEVFCMIGMKGLSDI
jgi:hypothetical protein